MKRGFTLIELLAVIVILAIIALIATPIVLSIIEDTRESATLRSAEFYLNVVEQSIMKKNMNAGGSFSPNICVVQNNGNLLCDSKDTLEVEVNGEVPSSGTITFEEGKITDVTLILENKTVIKNEEGKLAYEEVQKSICKLIDGEANTIGSKYQCKVKDDMEEGFEGGYYFFVLSHNDDGTTNLIMDRNICKDGTVATAENTCSTLWMSQTDYELAGGTQWDDYDDRTYYGPVTAMNFLNNATSTWENIDNLNITYDDEGENFTDFALNGKARLPYYSEMSNYSVSSNNAYLYDNLDLKCWDDDEANLVSCDVSNIIHGVDEEGMGHISGIGGYWTLSSSANYSDNAISVWYRGSTYDGPAGEVGFISIGARPVINLKL